MNKSFRDLGLPDGLKVLALAYHAPTRTLVTHVGPLQDVPPRKRLFFRGATDTHYQPIGEFPEGISVDSFVLDPSRPALYFATGSWWGIAGGRAAGDWDALYRFDLEQHQCEPLTRRGALRPPEGYEKKWLCELLAPGADGRSLFCKAALWRESRAEYWVAELDLAGLALRPITKLDASFA